MQHSIHFISIKQSDEYESIQKIPQNMDFFTTLKGIPTPVQKIHVDVASTYLHHKHSCARMTDI